MRSNIVFTLTGKDRIGIVEEVTQLFLAHGGNVEMSRMARLGGEFAILTLVSLPQGETAKLGETFGKLTAQGYKITSSLTHQKDVENQEGWRPYQIEVRGADHEGIIHEIARYLSTEGINIEAMDTGTKSAPLSGTTMFTMVAVVAVPPSLLSKDWKNELQKVADKLDVEINVSDAKQK